jgi:hypothetical protein
LREATPIKSGPASLSFVTQSIGPGQSILVPIGIKLPKPERPSFQSAKQSQEIFTRVGLNGYSGSKSQYGLEDLKDFVYGPEVDVEAVGLNGRRLFLKQQPRANFTRLVPSIEGLSCPYLLAWSDKDREWINHGKVLHEAPSSDREYTERRTFAGFVSRFRIEEREPELAFIDQVTLTVRLTNGVTFTLATEHPQLSARDADYLQLYWGESVSIDFSLPFGVYEADVDETQIAVSGYYRRYSALMSEGVPAANTPTRASISSLLRLAKTPAASVCPIPSRMRIAF